MTNPQTRLLLGALIISSVHTSSLRAPEPQRQQQQQQQQQEASHEAPSDKSPLARGLGWLSDLLGSGGKTPPTSPPTQRPTQRPTPKPTVPQAPATTAPPTNPPTTKAPTSPPTTQTPSFQPTYYPTGSPITQNSSPINPGPTATTSTDATTVGSSTTAATTTTTTTTTTLPSKWYPNLPNGSSFCSLGPQCTTEPSSEQGDTCYYPWFTNDPATYLYDTQVACCAVHGCQATTTTTEATPPSPPKHWYPNFPHNKDYCSYGPECTTEPIEEHGDSCYFSWQKEFFDTQAACCQKYVCSGYTWTTTTTVATTTEGPVTTNATETTTATTTTAGTTTTTTTTSGLTTDTTTTTTTSTMTDTEPTTTTAATTTTTTNVTEPTTTTTSSSSTTASTTTTKETEPTSTTTTASTTTSTETEPTSTTTTTTGTDPTTTTTTSSTSQATEPTTTTTSTTTDPTTTTTTTSKATDPTTTTTTTSKATDPTTTTTTTSTATDPTATATTSTTTTTTTAKVDETTTTATTTGTTTRPAKWYPNSDTICVYGDDYPDEYWNNLAFRTTVLFDTRQDCCNAYGGNSCDTTRPTTQVTAPPTTRSPDNCYPNARYVKLQSTTGSPIQVFEVEVLSSNVNVAVGKNASNSATLGKNDGGKAVDGKHDTFSHTTDSADGSEWWQVDLGKLYSVDTVVVHNRWCKDGLTPSPCLCRLSKAVLSLNDENGKTIATSAFGDTCGQTTLVVSYDPKCPGPTPAPTKVPTLPPVWPRRWYPDQTAGVHDCIFGNDYPLWMTGGPNESNYLFITEDDCCHKHQCDGYYTEMWYPEVMNGHIMCLYGKDYPVLYKQTPQGYLFETEDACCQEYGCLYKYTTSPTESPSKRPTDAPTTSAPTTATPTKNPITSAPSTATPTTSSPTKKPTTRAPISSAPTSTSPTKKPVTSPPTIHDPNLSETKPEYWYPDIDTPGNDCVFGTDYKSWMALPHWFNYYLFGSKAGCCCAFTCDDMTCPNRAPPFFETSSSSTTTTSTTTTTTTTTTTPEPTSKPTTSPTKQSFWFPDVNGGTAEVMNCVYGSNYEPFMALYDNFLFSSEEECCLSKGPCAGWHWYPDLGPDVVGKKCIFGKNYPSWMAKWDGFLFSTEEDCCQGGCTA